MAPHPVQFQVAPGLPTQRIHVVIRVALLGAIATVGCSSLYWLLYLALPALVALRILQTSGERYIAEDAPRIVRALKWLAAAYAYLLLLTDVLPTAEGSPTTLEIAPTGTPTATTALLRLLYGVPALALIIVLSLAVGFLWLAGAVVILVNRRLPAAIADFVAFTLRFQFRLAAYHLSLVDRYPSFAASGEEGGPLPASADPLTHL